MADSKDDNQEKALVVPENIKKDFPEFSEMIQASHSMNTEERQYWIDVLPIMSDDQLVNLRDILENERDQIEEAETAYEKDMEAVATKSTVAFDDVAYHEKKTIRLEAERKHEAAEKDHEAALLAELENL